VIPIIRSPEAQTVRRIAIVSYRIGGFGAAPCM